ncbi:MAG: NAD-dependent epimerase/dehydratase family protein [Bryobacteraceae bacterium]
MRVLVLGGTGFIGPHIVRRLLAYGHHMTVFRRGSAVADVPEGVHVIVGDRNRLEASAAAFSDLRPDIVVDVIAFTEEQAKGLMAALSGIAKRIVVLSSGDVYRANDLLFRRIQGTVDPTPLNELSPLRDRLYPCRGVPVPPIEGFSWDDYDKIMVERMVMGNAELPATVLRLPMVYGPGDYGGQKRRFWAYLKRMDDGRPAILLDQRTARWRAPWGYVADVAEAVRLAVENERAAGEVYNVGEAEGLDLQGWVQELAAVVGWRGRILVVDEQCPAPNLPRSLNLDQNLDMDTTKIRHDLRYQETMSRNEALERTVRWDRDHPPKQTAAAQFDYPAEDVIFGHAIR